MNDLSFIPECYVDTNLIETLVPPQSGYNHQKGCGTVSNRMRGKMADAFAVGIIDRDKKDLDYLQEFYEVKHIGNLYLFKHATRHHYLIQISPAIERFILDNAGMLSLDMNHYGLPGTLPELKKISKVVNSKKDVRFKRLFRDIKSGNATEFITLTAWLTYLKEKTYDADVNELMQL